MEGRLSQRLEINSGLEVTAAAYYDPAPQGLGLPGLSI